MGRAGLHALCFTTHPAQHLCHTPAPQRQTPGSGCHSPELCMCTQVSMYICGYMHAKTGETHLGSNYAPVVSTPILPRPHICHAPCSSHSYTH